jgi:hypothetical protein
VFTAPKVLEVDKGAATSLKKGTVAYGPLLSGAAKPEHTINNASAGSSNSILANGFGASGPPISVKQRFFMNSVLFS